MAVAIPLGVAFLTMLLWGTTDFVHIGSWRLSWIVVPFAGLTLAALFIVSERDTWRLGRDFRRTPIVETGTVVYTEHVPGGGEGEPAVAALQ